RTERPKTRLGRHIEAALPPGAVTHVILTIPETGIEARFARGTLTMSSAENAGTRLEGFLDPSGRLDLSWSRAAPERGAITAQLRSHAHALFTVHEGRVETVVAFDFDVYSGELESLGLNVPAELEITDLTGDNVRKWGVSETHRLAVQLTQPTSG